MTRALIVGITTLVASTQAAQACGRGCHHRAPRVRRAAACRATYSSRPIYQPAYLATQGAPAPTPAPAIAPVSTVQPTYNYQPGEGQAYYYSYDESGKLIIVQWMDWLFRGGKAAGMPRPPLPIVGYLGNR